MREVYSCEITTRNSRVKNEFHAGLYQFCHSIDSKFRVPLAKIQRNHTHRGVRECSLTDVTSRRRRISVPKHVRLGRASPRTRIIDFHEILFSKFAGGCSISAVTRELSRAFVMQRARSAPLPQLVHATPRRSFTNIVPRRSLPPNFET